MLSTYFEELPDDIIDIIYSKIIYKKPKNLLDQIIKYGENREYLYYLDKLDTDLLYDCLYDIVIIHLLLYDNIVPSSCDPQQLNDDNCIKLDNIIFDMYNKYDEFDVYKAYNLIYKIIMNIDNYYVEKIIEPYISVIKFDELNNIGYLTYKGV
tara:strand:+ start:4131 stop:4589 length:459 start_codon:yes stop_codon:yes gene_type:complete